MRAALLVAAILGALGAPASDARSSPAVPSHPAPLDWNRPAFCGHLDCPPYVVAGEGRGYEIRSYNATYWAVTVIEGEPYWKAAREAVWRFVEFFGGANYEGASMDLTASFTAILTWKDGEKSRGAANRWWPPSCHGEFRTQDKFSFLLWIPSNRQDEPPIPTDDRVLVGRFPKTVLYTRVFGGYGIRRTLEAEATHLQDILEDRNETFWRRGFGTRAYDGPWKIFFRRNDVYAYDEDPTDSLDRVLAQARLDRAAALRRAGILES